VASFWSWLWEKISTALEGDNWLKLDRETVQEAVHLIQSRLEEEAARLQVNELRIEDLSEAKQLELYGELERLLRPKVQALLKERAEKKAR